MPRNKQLQAARIVSRKLPLGVEPDPDDLGEQGCRLRTIPPHIVIAGTRGAGTLHGVHRFLEAYLGVRWFAPGVTRTPRVRTVRVPPLDERVRPAFLSRRTSYAWPGRDADFLARVGMNAGNGDHASPHGLQYDFDGTCHSYFRFVSPGEFFETNPEFFSEIAGARVRDETQLCLTNPRVLDIVTQRMLERMRARPGARQHNFSQMDYYNVCECAGCRAVNERYGTNGGTQFLFVNRLAERTSREFPDKLVGTLAYTYTEEPPRDMAMHPNVAVWLCHMFPCCDSHPIDTCPRNSVYKRRAQAWARICSHLYVWHYVVDFAHYFAPFPNLRAMAADMRFYRRIGTEGVYLQGMGAGGGGGEFSLLRPYLGMKLLWDPDIDAETVIREFLTGVYGPAADPLHRYITLLHDKVADEDIHMHLYTNPAQGFLPDDTIRAAQTLFDEAEGAVKDDPVLLERVLVARMPLTYARLFPRNGYTVRGNRLAFLGDPAGPDEASAFIQRMGRHGFRSIREHGGDPRQLVPLSQMIQAGADLKRLRNAELEVDLVPALGGRVLRISHVGSAQSVTAWNHTRNLYFPFAGGIEARVGETYYPVGFMEPASVADADALSATLVTALPGKLLLTRRVSLHADRPVLHVDYSVRNTGTKPRRTRLCAHLELDLGTLDDTRVRFASRSGKREDVGMDRVVPRLREGCVFGAGTTPREEWRLTGTKGLELTHRFHDDEVLSAWLYSYPADLGQLDAELWGHPVDLAPGQETTLRQTLDVRAVTSPER